MPTREIAAALLLIALTACGCDKGPQTGELSGDVTLDGAPVKAATIGFFSPTTDEATAISSVVAGKYTIEAPVGTAVVRLNAIRIVEVDKKKISRGYKYTEKDLNPERFPAKYNSATQLRVEVKPGPQTHDFHLTTK